MLASIVLLVSSAIAFPKPDSISLDGAPAGARVEVTADGRVLLRGGEASWIVLRWAHPFDPGAKVFGDIWERSRGDHRWARLGDPDSCKSQNGAMSWFFLVEENGRTDGYGVKVQPNSFASWRADTKGFALTLDVRAGSRPVQLGSRTLEACALVDIRGRAGETAFQVGRRFCRLMCPTTRAPKEPMYGFNDWYNTYGKNTATNFLEDVRFWFGAMDRAAAKAGKTVANRPYAVADDGWQQPGWHDVNARWAMPMPEFARRVRALNARPGLWYRPLYRRKANPVDPTPPEIERGIREDIARFRAWGFDLVKVDFLVYDWGGTWGYKMSDTPVPRDDRVWRRRDRTSAEVALALYRAMREAAGDKMAIIGCNALNHFAAGLFEANRTGDDTCGFYWPCVGTRGPNAVGMRAIENNVFFAVDGDTVAWNDSSKVPIHKPIAWRMNRQWLDLLARSGTAAFLSWSRQNAREGDVDFIAESLVRAAGPHGECEPLDWQTQSSPRRWRFGAETAEYDWEVLSANSTPFVPDPAAELQTAALQAAIDRAAAAGGGRVVVPKGVWKIDPVVFRRGTGLRFVEGAVLQRAGADKEPLVTADGVDGFVAEGPGTIGGRGCLLCVAHAKEVAICDVMFAHEEKCPLRLNVCTNVYVGNCQVGDGAGKARAARLDDVEVLDSRDIVVEP